MGLRLVVSTNNYEYMDFKCIRSLQNIEWDNVEVLIFNSCKDSEVDTILELSKAGNSVEKIIYINQQINSLYYGLFAGVNADIYSDETMLKDEETLEYLVDEFKNTGMTIQSPSADVETISKFVAAVSKESADSLQKLVKNSIWVKTLESSFANVETALVRTNESNTSMVEMFNKTSEIIETLQEGQERTTEEIEKLNMYLEQIEKSGTSKTMNLFDFPTFAVPNSISRVLYIKVYSPCKYLLSFMLAYQNYLKMYKQINTKILLCVPKLKQCIKKYEIYPRLATETMGRREIQAQEVLVTHEPKSQILTSFFNMKSDGYIVIDLMYGSTLLSGARVKTLSAVSGITDQKNFQLDAKRCITSDIGLNSNLVIPKIQKYGYTKSGTNGNTVPTTQSTKLSKYFDACKDKAYLRLNAELGIQ